MRQQNNLPVSNRQRNLDINLSVNPVEDGNTPVNNPNQGNLYVSFEGDQESDYLLAFQAAVIGWKNNGDPSNNYYDIEVEYEVKDVGLSGKGVFGTNLIKDGEPFTIVGSTRPIITDPPNNDGPNFIKGYVNKVISTSVVTNPSHVITCIYVLSCVFTEGDPAVLIPGTTNFIFRTDRRIYTEESNIKGHVPPTNLVSTLKGNESIFFWEDPTNLAVGYRLYLREANNPSSQVNLKVNGNHAEFFGSMETTLGLYGQLGTYRITDFGVGCSQPTFNVYSTTSGTPPQIVLHTDSCGSVESTEWEIVTVDTTAYPPDPSPTSVLNVVVRSSGKLPWRPLDLTTPGTTIDFLGLDIKGLAGGIFAISGSNGMYTLGISNIDPPIKYNSYTELREKMTFQKLRIHTGIEIISAGSGMTKPPKLYYDKYPTNTKFATYIGTGSWYWSVASVFDCEQKTYSEWSPEELLIIR